MWESFTYEDLTGLFYGNEAIEDDDIHRRIDKLTNLENSWSAELEVHIARAKAGNEDSRWLLNQVVIQKLLR